jgi:hypothetical protein
LLKFKKKEAAKIHFFRQQATGKRQKFYDQRKKDVGRKTKSLKLLNLKPSTLNHKHIQ